MIDAVAGNGCRSQRFGRRRQRVERRHGEHAADVGERSCPVAAARGRLAGGADGEVGAAVGQRVPAAALHLGGEGEPGMRRLPVAAVGVELRHQREHQRERHGGVDGDDERRLPAGADPLHPLLQLARGPQQDATSRTSRSSSSRRTV